MAMPGVRRHLGAGRRVAIPEVIATSGSKPEGDPEVCPSPPVPRPGRRGSDQVPPYNLMGKRHKESSLLSQASRRYRRPPMDAAGTGGTALQADGGTPRPLPLTAAVVGATAAAAAAADSADSDGAVAAVGFDSLLVFVFWASRHSPAIGPGGIRDTMRATIGSNTPVIAALPQHGCGRLWLGDVERAARPD